MNKRTEAGLMNDDPMEELKEIYSEVQIIEADFKKALGISLHMLGHSKELFHANRNINDELDSLRN